MKSIIFYNSTGGVDKNFLVYHLAWMLSELGKRVLVADLDPQAHLTSWLLEEEQLKEIWLYSDQECNTIYKAIAPLVARNGDIAPVHIQNITEGLGLIPGDLSLSLLEDAMSEAWNKCSEGDEHSFRVISSFYKVFQSTMQSFDADILLIEADPSMGAINRSALLASQYWVNPVAPDFFCLQGLRNTGSKLRTWREDWQTRYSIASEAVKPEIPLGLITPIGYILTYSTLRFDRPRELKTHWIERISADYRSYVLGMEDNPQIASESDENLLAEIKKFVSLMQMAQEARKPMFFLKPVDGALGSHVRAVMICYEVFKQLANTIWTIVDAEEQRVSI